MYDSAPQPIAILDVVVLALRPLMPSSIPNIDIDVEPRLVQDVLQSLSCPSWYSLGRRCRGPPSPLSPLFLPGSLAASSFPKGTSWPAPFLTLSFPKGPPFSSVPFLSHFFLSLSFSVDMCCDGAMYVVRRQGTQHASSSCLPASYPFLPPTFLINQISWEMESYSVVAGVGDLCVHMGVCERGCGSVP